MIVSTLTQWNRYALLVMAICFFQIINLSAATVTWTGGISNWNIAANWDIGSIPTAADDVIITAGRVNIPTGYVAMATSVDVQAGDLWIRANGSLLLANASDRASLSMAGRMRVDGNLEIINSVNNVGFANSGTAILNIGRSTVGSSGQLLIDQTDDYGIWNEPNAQFTNVGDMTLTNIGTVGIINFYRFNNRGDLNITAGTTGTQSAIVNFDIFYNYASGAIISEGGATANVLNNSTAEFKNYGAMNIDLANNKGVINYGDFYNYDSGDMEIYDAASSCIYNTTGGRFFNYGNIEALLGGSEALLNYGVFYNLNFLNLIGGGSGDAYRDFAGAGFKNAGLMYLQSIAGSSMQLNGYFGNTTSGNCFVYEKIYVSNGATLMNEGFLTSDYTLTHWKAGGGVINNFGGINDINGSFSTYITNSELVVQPLTSAMQDGVPFPNVLDAVSLSDFTVGTWTTSAGGPIAGSYDPVLNEFTPNASAIGATSLRINVTNNFTGAGLLFTLNLSSPVLPTVSPDIVHQTYHETLRIDPLNDAQIEVYPNPTSGSFWLKGQMAERPIDVQVVNSLGQMVLEKRIEQSDDLEIRFPENFANGLYQLLFKTDNQQLKTQSILLQR